MIRVLGLLLIHMLMTALPMMAAMLLAARLRVRSVPVLLAIGLAAGGALAMVDFWVFYADPTPGKIFSLASLIVCFGYVCWSLSSGAADGALLRALGTPLALWAFACTFLVFLGFLHGGIDSSVGMATTRFYSSVLPSDSNIPQFFTDWFYLHGHHGTPPIYPGGWEMSDRPPLQIGYMLSQRPWGWDTDGLNYQLIGVALQQLWVVGLWALLIASRIGTRARALVMLVVLVSGLTILNGFFVWPKLLPAAMILAAAALVITPAWAQIRDRALGARLVGALIALGMLGHGTSLFPAIALALVMIRSIPRPRWVMALLLAFVALYAPWAAYQKYADPPGDRLTKWFLGGDVGPDNKPALPEIIHAYEHAGFGGALHNKAENFVLISGGAAATSTLSNAISSIGHGQLDQAIRDLRSIFFFFLIPTLGLLLAAPFLVALRRWRAEIRGDEWRFTKTGLRFAFVSVVIWALVLWGGTVGAVLHQGSYAVPIVVIAVCVTALYACSPRIATWICGAQMVLTLLVYTPSIAPPVGSAYSALAAILAIAGLIGYGALLARSGDGDLVSHRPATSAPVSISTAVGAA